MYQITDQAYAHLLKSVDFILKNCVRALPSANETDYTEVTNFNAVEYTTKPHYYFKFQFGSIYICIVRRGESFSVQCERFMPKNYECLDPDPRFTLHDFGIFETLKEAQEAFYDICSQAFHYVLGLPTPVVQLDLFN